MSKFTRALELTGKAISLWYLRIGQSLPLKAKTPASLRGFYRISEQTDKPLSIEV